MTYDPKGLCEELYRSQQWVTLEAVENTLKVCDDRSFGSRTARGALVRQVQDTPQKDERNWAKRMAGSDGVSSNTSSLVRI